MKIYYRNQTLFFLFIFLFSHPLFTSGQEIRSKDEARDIAINTLVKNSPFRDLQNLDCKIFYSKTDLKPKFFLFKDSIEGAFVIVSAQKGKKEILAYSLNSPIQDSLPLGAKDFLQIYLNKEHSNFSRNKNSNHTSVSPLLKEIKWGQEMPYNHLSPLIRNESLNKEDKAATGCVATAMASIMRFHKHPLQGKGKYTYLWHKNTFSVNFEKSFYDWENMLPNYSKQNYSDKERDAVAKLLFDCAVSVTMNWGTPLTGGSGAYSNNAALAFFKHFQYDPSLRYLNRMMFSYDDWKNIILKELQEGRPVYYAGKSFSGGHAFVCDGYDAEKDLFHINWGWDGLADGYYDLKTLQPSSPHFSGAGSFSYDQEIIIGLKPKDKNSKSQFAYTTAMLYSDVEIKEGRYKKEEKVDLIYPTIVSVGVNDIEGMLTAGFLFNEKKECVDTLFMKPIGDIKNRFYRGIKCEISCPKKNLPNGEYTLKPYYRDRFSEQFIPIQYYRGIQGDLSLLIDDQNISYSIKSIKAKLKAVSSLSFKEQLTPYDKCEAIISIKNIGGSEFLSLVAIEAQKAGQKNAPFLRLYEQRVCIEKGQTLECHLKTDELKLLEGKYIFRISYDSENKEAYEGANRPYKIILDNIPTEVFYSPNGAPILNIKSKNIPMTADFQKGLKGEYTIYNSGGEYKGKLQAAIFIETYKGLELFQNLEPLSTTISTKNTLTFPININANNIELGTTYVLGVSFEKNNNKNFIKDSFHKFIVEDNRLIIPQGIPLLDYSSNNSLLTFQLDVINNDNSGKRYRGKLYVNLQSIENPSLKISFNQKFNLDSYLRETFFFQGKFKDLPSGEYLCDVSYIDRLGNKYILLEKTPVQMMMILSSSIKDKKQNILEKRPLNILNIKGELLKVLQEGESWNIKGKNRIFILDYKGQREVILI